MNERTLYTIYFAMIAGAIGWSLYRTFTNIDMTRTRLFLTFWPEWVVIFVLLLVMQWIIYKRNS